MNAQADQFIRCDTCKQTFAQKANSYVKREGDVETFGLACPHCGARYEAYRTNKAIRDLQAKVAAERHRATVKIRAGTPPNKAERRKLPCGRSTESEKLTYLLILSRPSGRHSHF